jgi:tetratricopeptide (TPR) repeat protein
MGIATYIRQSTRDPLPVAMTIPSTPQAAPESELPLSQLAPAPRPQALQKRPPTAQPRTALSPLPTPEAEPEISRAERHDRAAQQFNNGIAAYNAGAFDEAETALQQAIALDPSLKGAFNRLGNLYYQRDAYEQALAMYQKALALDPNYLEARNNLGNTYMRLDMSAQAIAELHKAIAVDRESGLTYYNMACVYARTGETDKAIRYLEMAIAREPEARHWAKTDTDFTAVRPTPVFQQLLGTSS